MKQNLLILIVILILAIGSTGLLLYMKNQLDTEEEYNQQLLEFKQQVRNELKEFNMIKRIRNNKGIIEPKQNFTKIEKLSHYQTFVTPNLPVISEYIQSEGIATIEDAYTTAVSWTWVSDQTLHGIDEKWLKPIQFILDTSDKTKYPTNPINGMASDCESQAYTLVSIIESLGIPKEHIRVCIGLVDFGSGSGGHAWVQVYTNGRWYELEATSGPYWDNDTNQLIESPGAGIDYFKTRPYPVEEYWVFFNDIYYYNPDTNEKSSNLPTYWMTTEKPFTLQELKARNIKP